mmetsp:Transcript_25198/g.28024  ORF Transcript_25198/g.28024 Transcript_25198/m.28024 type:complete len:454 (-) Transcript_25198:68-1429(-)
MAEPQPKPRRQKSKERKRTKRLPEERNGKTNDDAASPIAKVKRGRSGSKIKLNGSSKDNKKETVSGEASSTVKTSSKTQTTPNSNNQELPSEPNLEMSGFKEKTAGPVQIALELEDIVQQKSLLLLFRDYLHEIYSGENLAFWLEAELYKNLPLKKRPLRAREIFRTFLDSENSKSRLVNVDNKDVVEAIKTNLDTGDEGLFTLAQNRIWGLLKLESYPRFLRNCEPFHFYVKCNAVPKLTKERRDELKRSNTVTNINEFLKKLKENKRKGIVFKPAAIVEAPKEKSEEDEENLYDQPDVEEILDDRELLLAFREFLYTTYANENLAFWLEAELYRQIKSKKELKSRCKEIYDKFCKPESLQAINLDWSTQNRLASDVKTFSSKTFEVAQQEIWKVLKNEWFPEFCLSQHFKDLESGDLEFKETKPTADPERRNTVFYYDELLALRTEQGLAN